MFLVERFRKFISKLNQNKIRKHIKIANIYKYIIVKYLAHNSIFN